MAVRRQVSLVRWEPVRGMVELAMVVVVTVVSTGVRLVKGRVWVWR